MMFYGGNFSSFPFLNPSYPLYHHLEAAFLHGWIVSTPETYPFRNVQTVQIM